MLPSLIFCECGKHIKRQVRKTTSTCYLLPTASLAILITYYSIFAPIPPPRTTPRVLPFSLAQFPLVTTYVVPSSAPRTCARISCLVFPRRDLGPRSVPVVAANHNSVLTPHPRIREYTTIVDKLQFSSPCKLAAGE